MFDFSALGSTCFNLWQGCSLGISYHELVFGQSCSENIGKDFNHAPCETNRHLGKSLTIMWCCLLKNHQHQRNHPVEQKVGVDEKTPCMRACTKQIYMILLGLFFLFTENILEVKHCKMVESSNLFLYNFNSPTGLVRLHRVASICPATCA